MKPLRVEPRNFSVPPLPRAVEPCVVLQRYAVSTAAVNKTAKAKARKNSKSKQPEEIVDQLNLRAVWGNVRGAKVSPNKVKN